MAFPFGAGPGWRKVSDLIAFFVLNGCVLDKVSPHLEDDGARLIRYLYSPLTKDFVSLGDYDNDDFIPPSEVANWERRLGYKLP